MEIVDNDLHSNIYILVYDLGILNIYTVKSAQIILQTLRNVRHSSFYHPGVGLMDLNTITSN